MSWGRGRNLHTILLVCKKLEYLEMHVCHSKLICTLAKQKMLKASNLDTALSGSHMEVLEFHLYHFPPFTTPFQPLTRSIGKDKLLKF